MGTYDRKPRCLYDLWDLNGDVIEHVVMLRVLRVRCVQVEAST